MLMMIWWWCMTGTWQGEQWTPGVSNLTQVVSSILFFIFVEEPYFNEPGYHKTSQESIHQSEQYNRVIQAATLQYGYHDHFKRKSQLSPFILPVLCKNWHEKGKQVALKWQKDQPKLAKIIDSIDEEVKNYEYSCSSCRSSSMKGKKTKS